MVQKIRLWALLALIAAAVSGCDSKEPIDRDIEGFWQLEYFETAADGQRHDCERLYFSITRSLVEVSERQGSHGYPTFVGRFKYVDGSNIVAMENFKHIGNVNGDPDDGTGDNGVDATAEELMPYGMNAATTTFDVVSANGKSLILKSDYATLYLKRF